MTYSRDWLESTPIDHTKFSAQPGHVRSNKVDVAERLENMFNGFISGETQTNEGVKNLPFVVQGSDPGAAASKVKLYSKDISAKAELFVQDEDADIIQLTAGGKANAAALGGVYAVDDLAAVAAILEHVYPVGSVVSFGVSTNPATLLGIGTWTAIEGKVIVGIGAGDAEFDTLDETGGAKTHTLTEAELAAHNHDIIMHKWTGQGNGTNPSGSSQDSTQGTNTTDIQNSGSGSAHNNLQPYIVKYVWQRTA